MLTVQSVKNTDTDRLVRSLKKNSEKIAKIKRDLQKAGMGHWSPAEIFSEVENNLCRKFTKLIHYNHVLRYTLSSRPNFGERYANCR